MSFIGRIHAYGTDNAYGTYGYNSGTDPNATVAVPSGAYLDTVSAIAGDTPGSFGIVGMPNVPVPAHGSVTLDVALGIMSPPSPATALTVQFTGVTGWLVEWRGIQ